MGGEAILILRKNYNSFALAFINTLRVFFQHAISSLTKQKKCLLEVSYETGQTPKLKLFTKKSY